MNFIPINLLNRGSLELFQDFTDPHLGANFRKLNRYIQVAHSREDPPDTVLVSGYIRIMTGSHDASKL
jgi:hypothetical protein